MRQSTTIGLAAALVAAACSATPAAPAAPEVVGTVATTATTAAVSGTPASPDGPGAEGTVAAPGGEAAPDGASYPVVDTGQTACWDDAGWVIACPGEGEAFFGQDGNYERSGPSYRDNGDGTVTDLVTGLMWQQDPGEKTTYAEAAAGAAAFDLAGYDDWRLPTIKVLYSLIDFSGTDPSGCTGAAGCDAVPFLDEVFAFSYGDTTAGERFIDSQWATGTVYTGLTMGGDETVFGVNFADGRIKGYPIADPRGGEKEFFVVYVRGNEEYGVNDFTDNGDGTVTDLATTLMWQQEDGGAGMEWAKALAYCEAAGTGGYDDWRLPDAKELQSIVDYTRSPQATGTAAIDPVFSTTTITDEGGGEDWGSYWSSTTHAGMRGGGAAVYVAFGEALGWMQTPQGGYELLDVHGAGAQRSDPKTGDAADYPYGNGPQGDVIRIDNLVRCVRGGDAAVTAGSPGDAAAPADGAPNAPGGPLAGAAAALGVTEEGLAAALGDPSQGPPDLEEAARLLGVSVEDLRAVLPPPPAGG